MFKNKKKVCFLIPSVKSGGIETYLLRFLNYLNGSMEVTVLVRGNAKGELFEAYTETGVRIVFKPLGYFNLSSMYWYYRFFKRENFDTVCDFNANFAGLPIFISKQVGVKKRITFYRQGSDHFKKSALRKAYNRYMNRLVFKCSTSIYANSSAGLEFFFPDEYPQDSRFKVIKNGVNIEEYLKGHASKEELREKLQLPQNKYIIGHTGRFTEAKNQYFLLDVAATLIAENKNIYFVLIGNGTDNLIPYINKLGIHENVQVLGYKSTIPEYLKSFDLFIFPSVTEGQPNALIEAMIAGLPIAVANIPSIVECLPEDRHGCLIDPYNVKTAGLKIKEIIKDPENYMYQQFAVDNFDAKVQFEEFRKNL